MLLSWSSCLFAPDIEDDLRSAETRTSDHTLVWLLDVHLLRKIEASGPPCRRGRCDNLRRHRSECGDKSGIAERHIQFIGVLPVASAVNCIGGAFEEELFGAEVCQRAKVDGGK
jgi:hypothetical protein